jgi:hypothetical protein
MKNKNVKRAYTPQTITNTDWFIQQFKNSATGNITVRDLCRKCSKFNRQGGANLVELQLQILVKEGVLKDSLYRKNQIVYSLKTK